MYSIFKRSAQVLSGVFFLCMLGCAGGREEITTPQFNDLQPLDSKHKLWNDLLQKAADPNGFNYQLIAIDDSLQEQLARYRAQLALSERPDDPNAEKALLINAYNAFTISLVLETLPKDPALWDSYSVKKVPGFWTKYYFELCGEFYNLDDIEHKQLRPLGDPRIHMAVNCASESCPVLHNQAFNGDNLTFTLDQLTSNFVNNPYQIRTENGKIQANEIMKWFGKDFKTEGGVDDFLEKYVDPNKRPELNDALKNDAPISYWDYEWNLNQKEPTK